MTADLDILYDNLFRKMYGKLYFYAKRFVDEENARDIVEDVFVDLWKRRETIEFGSRIQSLLYCSTHSKCINLLKHNKVSASHIALIEEINVHRMEVMDELKNTPESELENEELGKLINQAIDELPEKCREVFKLSYLQDMRNDEIATILGISARTVEAHMYRALKVLRQRLSHIPFFLIFFAFSFKYIFSGPCYM